VCVTFYAIFERLEEEEGEEEEEEQGGGSHVMVDEADFRLAT
jgi:hypothetical protein